MFDSSSQNPFSHSMETFFKQSYTNDQNPNSIQEETPFTSNFTSPSLYDHEWPLSEILPKQKSLPIDHADVVVQNENPMNNSSGIDKNINLSLANHAGATIPALMHRIPSKLHMANEAPIQPKPCEVKPSRRRNLDTMKLRKRTGKKDRHSKICTAQGIRDRRMRLSLHIARKFFDLQDMLGFDKASKTIEWLFSKSKKAIKELQVNVQETKCSSNSEEESELLMSEHYEVISNFVHANESRHKAIATARERTKEKMMIKSLDKNKHLYESNPNCLDQLGFSNHFEIALEESTSCNKKSYFLEADSNSIEHQFANVDRSKNYPGAEIFKQLDCPFVGERICHSSVITNDSSNRGEVSHGLEYNPCSAGFLGNWDTNFRINSSNDGIMDVVTQAGNRASTCFSASRFPFQL